MVKYGGHIEITNVSIKKDGLCQMQSHDKEASGMSEEVFKKLNAKHLDQMMQIVKLYNIPDCLILNWDQTGIKFVPTGDWMMAAEGSRMVEMAGLGNKRQIIATFMVSLYDILLPMQLLYQEKTDHSHPRYAFLEGFDIFHSPNHWANEETCFRYFNQTFIPYIEKIQNDIDGGASPFTSDGLFHWPNNTFCTGEAGGTWHYFSESSSRNHRSLTTIGS